MNLGQSFKIAIKSLWAKKTRSVLTMLGVIIGVTAVVILVSIVQGYNKAQMDYYAKQGTNRINVYAYNWNGKNVTNELYDYCLGMEDLVLGVTPTSTYWAQNGIRYNTSSTNNMENGSPTINLGSDQFAICNNFTLEKGRDISYLDVKGYHQVIVLGARVAEYLFHYRSPLGEYVTIDGNRFQVIGVYEAKDPDSAWSMDNMAVVPYTMNRILNRSTEMNEFAVKAVSADATTAAITRLSGFLSGIIDENNGYYSVYSENQWIAETDEQTRLISLVVGGIAGISLLVGGIGIMNIMLVTVTERTREIGIRMAIGASRGTIILQFLIEASVICAFGGLLGVAVGWLGTLVAGKLLFDSVIMPNTAITVGAVAFSVVLGIGFGMYPAVKASGLQPLDALRSE